MWHSPLKSKIRNPLHIHCQSEWRDRSEARFYDLRKEIDPGSMEALTAILFVYSNNWNYHSGLWTLALIKSNWCNKYVLVIRSLAYLMVPFVMNPSPVMTGCTAVVVLVLTGSNLCHHNFIAAVPAHVLPFFLNAVDFFFLAACGQGARRGTGSK